MMSCCHQCLQCHNGQPIRSLNQEEEEEEEGEWKMCLICWKGHREHDVILSDVTLGVNSQTLHICMNESHL